VTDAFLRVRVGSGDAHYGDLAAGAFVMELFGDLATELNVRTDGDEGLLRAYREVEFLSPISPGDVLECRARLVDQGRTSRTFEAEAWRVVAARRDLSNSAAEVLAQPVLVARATGTSVVPLARQRRGPARSGRGRRADREPGGPQPS
jgi:3-aminobutyryl-CoA ammonia-lyase